MLTGSRRSVVRYTVLCGPLALLLLLLLAYPLGYLFWQSVRAGAGFGGANYLRIFTESSYRIALLHSLILSGAVAFASTLICLAPAWLFANERFFGRKIARAIFTLPMSFSGIIVGFLAVLMLGRIGAVPQFFGRIVGNDYGAGWAYRLNGLIIAYLYFEIPRATLTLEAALRKFDPQISLAARSLGAGAFQRLRYITLPLIWRPLVSTFAVTFTVSLGSFGVALIIAKRFAILPLEIYEQITGYGDNSLMSAMAITLFLLAFFINLLTRRIATAEAAVV